MVQIYNLKQGLNKFRTEGKKSASKEITQHRDLHTFHTIDHKTLTREEKQQALRSLIFLTKKGYRRVKPRMCADSSKQRRRLGYKKENYALSTCHTDPIFLTSVTGAKDGRKFATIDVPGIYLCASAAEEVIIPLEGRLAKLIVPVDPKDIKKSLDGSLLAFLRRASHNANTLRFHPPCPLLHEDCGVF